MRKLFIILAAVALVVSFTIPAAADVSFYGNVRMSTFWNNTDPGTPGSESDTDIFWDLDDSNSRFGAKFKSGAVSANVEIRPSAGGHMRQWNATWNFGAGSLLIGQAWAPTFIGSACGECYDGGIMGGYGGMNGSLRAGQVALHMGALKLALLKPTTTSIVAGPDNDNTLPKIEAQYALSAGPVGLTLVGGYNTCEEIDATKKSYDVDAYVLGAKWALGFGPAKVQGVLFMAKNPKEYAQVSSKAMAAALVGTEIKDVDSFGATIAFKYTISDAMAFEVGGGMSSHERDVTTTNESQHTAYYANLPITLAKGVTITPEIAVFEDETTLGATTTTADRTVYGAYWQINF